MSAFDERRVRDRRWGLVASVRRAAAVVACALWLTAAAQATAGHLRPAGRWLVDSHGRVVILHGVNMVNKRPPYDPAAIGFDGDDAAFLSHNGLNVVRLGVELEAAEPSPGRWNQTYLSSVAQTASLLDRYGIFFQLDFHQDEYSEQFGGQGFPGWAVDTGGLPNTKTEFPLTYLSDPALWHAFDSFWANEAAPAGAGLQDHVGEMFQRLASLVAGNPHLLGYELLNEPYPGTSDASCQISSGCSQFEQGALSQFYVRGTRAIRSVDPSTPILIEPQVAFDFGVPSFVNAPKDSNPIFSFHAYCVPPQTSEGNTVDSATPTNVDTQACKNTYNEVLGFAEQAAGRTGSVPLLSEFGAQDDAADMAATESLADQYMDSWEYWTYFQNYPTTDTRTSLASAIVYDATKPPTGANVNWPKLNAIAEPYPQAVAGTPLGYAYDPANGTFTLRYRTAPPQGDPRAPGGRFPAGSETDVYVPSLHYPHGYDVSVSGAAAVSRLGAPLLRLRSCAGHTTVTLHLKPGNTFSADCRPPGARGSVVPHHRRHRTARRPRHVVAPGFTG